MRRRTRGRELALQYLYSCDAGGEQREDELGEFLTRAKASQQHREFATRLVEGVRSHQQALDACIAERATNWTLDRIALVDRNILRLGAFELLFCPEVPREVVINEAVELGKRYSTAQSGAFINGILGHLEPPAAAPDAPHPEQPEQPEASS